MDWPPLSSADATPPPGAALSAASPAVPATPARRGIRARLPFGRGGGRPGEPGSGDAQPGAEKVMPLVDHLRELRHRLFVSFLSLIPGTALGFLYEGQIVHVLRAPLPMPASESLVVFGLADAFFIDLKIALVTGVIVAMPILLYQLWAFVSPGLTPSERTAARPWIPLALVFFVLGVGVAYFILPLAAGFLFGFQTEDIKLILAADRYFDFVTTLFLAFGLVMEFPILLVFLSKIHIVTSKRLASSRRMALVFITIFSAFITPGADLVSPLVMLVVMYSLYEASILLIRWTGN